MRIESASAPADSMAAFELDVRTRLRRITYQTADDIADGIRMVSPCSLWNEVAVKLGASAAAATTASGDLKKKLSIIVDRRNKIVHEGDLQPTVPRTPWPITRNDLEDVAGFIGSIVSAIDAIV